MYIIYISTLTLQKLYLSWCVLLFSMFRFILFIYFFFFAFSYSEIHIWIHDVCVIIEYVVVVSPPSAFILAQVLLEIIIAV